MSFYCNKDFKRNREDCKIYPTILSAINIFMSISRKIPTISGIFLLNRQEDFWNLLGICFWLYLDHFRTYRWYPKISVECRGWSEDVSRSDSTYISSTVFHYRAESHGLRLLPWQRSVSKNSDWVTTIDRTEACFITDPSVNNFKSLAIKHFYL